MKKIKILLLVMSAVLLPVSHLFAQNLVMNPSFENTTVTLCSPPLGAPYYLGGGYVADWTGYNAGISTGSGHVGMNGATCWEAQFGGITSTPYGNNAIAFSMEYNTATYVTDQRAVGKLSGGSLKEGCYQLCIAANGTSALGSHPRNNILQIVVKYGGGEKVVAEFSIPANDVWTVYSTTFNISVDEASLFDAVELRWKRTGGEKYSAFAYFDEFSIAPCGSMGQTSPSATITGYFNASISTTTQALYPSGYAQSAILEAYTIDNLQGQVDCWTLYEADDLGGTYIEIDHFVGYKPYYSPARDLIHCGKFYKLKHALLVECGYEVCTEAILYASCTEVTADCPTCDYTYAGGDPQDEYKAAPGSSSNIDKRQKINKPIGVEIAPNPTSSFVTISIAAFKERNPTATLILMDVNGKVLQKIEGLSEVNVLDMNKYAPGSYLLQVRSGTVVETHKISRE